MFEKVSEAKLRTKYIYDGFKVIQEKESGILGNHAVTYLRGSSLDEILSRTASPSVYYYEDIRGSVRGITDGNSNLIQSYEYTAFGERTSNIKQKQFLFFGNKMDQPYGFTGRPIDKVTGLYNYRMRDYNPEIGRFVQPDPLGQIPGPNIYAYCNNNPINWVDPWGMCRDLGEEIPWWERFDAYYDAFEELFTESFEWGASFVFTEEAIDLFGISSDSLNADTQLPNIWGEVELGMIVLPSVIFAVEGTLLDEVIENVIQINEDIRNLSDYMRNIDNNFTENMGDIYW